MRRRNLWFMNYEPGQRKETSNNQEERGCPKFWRQPLSVISQLLIKLRVYVLLIKQVRFVLTGVLFQPALKSIYRSFQHPL
jgi:hypothetical protein